jgi:HlyD family secretion protein
MSRNVLTTLVLAIVIAFCAGAYMLKYGLPWASGESSDEDAVDASVSVRDQVVALGRIAPAGGIHGVGAIPGDVLAEVPVEEGERVTKATVVAVLMSGVLRKLDVEALEKQLDEAKARSTAEAAAADSRIALATLAVEQARAGDEKIEAEEKQITLLESVWALEKKRFENLQSVSESAVSASERATQELLVEKADAELQAAKATLTSLRLANEFGLQKAEAELEAAKAAKDQVLAGLGVASLAKRLEQAKKQFELTHIRSPIDGVVLNIFNKPGEVIGPQRIMTIADIDRMVCRAEVYQNDVKYLRAALADAKGNGLEVRLTSDAFEAPYDEKGLMGRLIDDSAIGRVVSPPVTDPTDPFARSDVEVIQVQIALEGENAVVASRYVNLQVNVSFPMKGKIPASASRAPRDTSSSAAVSQAAGKN